MGLVLQHPKLPRVGDFLLLPLQLEAETTWRNGKSRLIHEKQRKTGFHPREASWGLVVSKMEQNRDGSTSDTDYG